jgi:signal transduction histidine kinase
MMRLDNTDPDSRHFRSLGPDCKTADSDATTVHMHRSKSYNSNTDIEFEKPLLPQGADADRGQETGTPRRNQNKCDEPAIDLAKCLSDSLIHDFNNSLQAIVSVLNVLESRIKDKPRDFDRLMGVVLASVEKARRQVRRLVNIEKASPYAGRPIEVNSTIESVEVLLASILGDPIQMRFELGSGEFHVHCDAQELEDLLLNLIANSRDAMPNGGKLLIETISAIASDHNKDSEPEPYVCIRVSDTGSGMSPTTIVHAFDPLYTTKRRLNGSGLGLWSVKNFVLRSGGHVTIQSVLGRGTSIQVLLPCLASSEVSSLPR